MGSSFFLGSHGVLLLLLLLLLLHLRFPSLVTAGQFGDSCGQLSVKKEQFTQYLLQAYCKDPVRAEWVRSTISLDVYLGNDDGRLVEGRAFSQSCGWYLLDGTVLSADCIMKNGSKKYGTTFDLNTRISNNYGQLSWDCQCM